VGGVGIGNGIIIICHGNLLKINGWYAGGAKETFCQANLAHVFYCVKGRTGKYPIRGGERATYWGGERKLSPEGVEAGKKSNLCFQCEGRLER
jgi:hypothetical protein